MKEYLCCFYMFLYYVHLCVCMCAATPRGDAESGLGQGAGHSKCKPLYDTCQRNKKQCEPSATNASCLRKTTHVTKPLCFCILTIVHHFIQSAPAAPKQTISAGATEKQRCLFRALDSQLLARRAKPDLKPQRNSNLRKTEIRKRRGA